MNKSAIKIKSLLLLIICGIVSVSSVFAQDTIQTPSNLKKKSMPAKKEPLALERTVIDGDTIAIYRMPEVKIQDQRVFKNKKDEKKYWKLVRNVKIALPYAKIANEKLVKYQAELKDKSKGARKRMMKQVEKDLLDEYGEELKGLTISQGRILLKLIDRETGHTSFELVESLRGWFSANFWQGIAVLFDEDLKSDFNPKESADDAMIEEIVLKVEKGEL